MSAKRVIIRLKKEEMNLPSLPPSDFPTLRENGCVYVDKTRFIEKLEQLRLYYPLIVRPPRFGKTLFATTLKAYYDKALQNAFDKNFSVTYISDHLTENRSAYCVLHFDFSDIAVDDLENSFNQCLHRGFCDFLDRYPSAAGNKFIERVQKQNPSSVWMDFLTMLPDELQSLFVIIDDYDAWARKLLATDRYYSYSESPSFINAFYERLKSATSGGAVKRIYMTGVSEIEIGTFNISQNISMYPEFADLFGFSVDELNWLTHEKSYQQTIDDLKNFCGGYQFSPKSEIMVCHPDACLQYLSSPSRIQNIDFEQLKSLMKFSNKEYLKDIANKVLHDEPVKTGSFGDGLTIDQKNLSKPNEMQEVLRYFGALTFAPKTTRYLRCPNRFLRDQIFARWQEEF